MNICSYLQFFEIQCHLLNNTPSNLFISFSLIDRVLVSFLVTKPKKKLDKTIWRHIKNPIYLGILFVQNYTSFFSSDFKAWRTCEPRIFCLVDASSPVSHYLWSALKLAVMILRMDCASSSFQSLLTYQNQLVCNFLLNLLR